MKCLRKYKWLKLHRACLPAGRGTMPYFYLLLFLGGLSIASLVLILFLTKGVQNGAFEALT